MKYGVWFVRLIFAAWMIPAGLNHFIPLFPQPLGSEPLSQELILALIDSDLFDLVKAVELVAGLCVLFGFYTPLALLVCLPVSFCVFYWDAPLEGWGSGAARFGYATFLCNLFLCAAYYKSYLKMFALQLEGDAASKLILYMRLLLGSWMLLSGINYFLLGLWDMPAGNQPRAIQLMTALQNSRLLDVALAIQLVAGVLLLAGRLIPVALYALMPVSVCALYWAVILDQSALNILGATLVFALNTLLMFMIIPSYRGVLARRQLAYCEREASV